MAGDARAIVRSGVLGRQGIRRSVGPRLGTLSCIFRLLADAELAENSVEDVVDIDRTDDFSQAVEGGA